MSGSEQEPSAMEPPRPSNPQRPQDDPGPALAALALQIADGGVPCRAVGLIDQEASPRSREWELAVTEAWPAARILRGAVPRRASNAAMDRLHLELAAAGPFDVLIDLSRSDPVARVFSELLYSLRRGGTFLGVRRLASGEARPTPFERLLGALLDDEPPSGTTYGCDLAALAASVEMLRRDGPNAFLAKRGETLAKIRPRDGDRLLELRPSVGRVVRTVPGAGLDVTAQLAASRPGYLATVPGRISAPTLSVREYDDVLVAPRQVVVSGHLILPETYRHHAQEQPRNPRVTDYSRGWAGPLTLRRPVMERPGEWFHLDGVYRGHFGHALTDVLSHLWAWAELKERHPRLKALVFPNHGRGVADWERVLLAGGGLAPEDLVLFKRPQRVATLLACSPMFSAPQYVHPGIAGTFAKIGAALAARAAVSERPRRIFSSRRELKRRCRNTAQVEAFFSARGFTVLYPEDHPLPDQVQLFRQAEVVAGFAGSGMFQLALTGAPKQVISVTSERYPIANEVLIAAVLGHRISIAVCDTDVPPTSGGLPAPPHKSDFTFDLAREGAYVDEVLANL